METKLYPEVETVTQYKPVLAHKVDRRYKWRYLLYKKIAIALFVLLTGMAFILGLTLKGNLALQQRLADSKTVTIMPSGKVLTSK